MRILIHTACHVTCCDNTWYVVRGEAKEERRRDDGGQAPPHTHGRASHTPAHARTAAPCAMATHILRSIARRAARGARRCGAARARCLLAAGMRRHARDTLRARGAHATCAPLPLLFLLLYIYRVAAAHTRHHTGQAQRADASTGPTPQLPRASQRSRSRLRPAPHTPKPPPLKIMQAVPARHSAPRSPLPSSSPPLSSQNPPSNSRLAASVSFFSHARNACAA
jgi:hypothetical protein